MFFVQKRDIQNMKIPYENKLPRLKNIYIYIYISRVEFGIPNNELMKGMVIDRQSLLI